MSTTAPGSMKLKYRASTSLEALSAHPAANGTSSTTASPMPRRPRDGLPTRTSVTGKQQPTVELLLVCPLAEEEHAPDGHQEPGVFSRKPPVKAMAVARELEREQAMQQLWQEQDRQHDRVPQQATALLRVVPFPVADDADEEDQAADGQPQKEMVVDRRCRGRGETPAAPTLDAAH